MNTRLAPFVRLRPRGEELLLLFPDGAFVLDAPGAAIARLLDGTLTEPEMARRLAREYGANAERVQADVRVLLERLARRGLLAEGTGALVQLEPRAATGGPDTMIAELTYRCPYRCAYCSNPATWKQHRSELDVAHWKRVLSEAAELGVLQVHFTGGEPLLHEDLEELVAHARSRSLYTQLITSGVPATRERFEALVGAGLDGVQLSLQGIDAEASREIAGLDGAAAKRAVAAWCRALDLPLTVNVVLHRQNIEHVPGFVEQARALGARRLELANAQYLGFALQNRDALLPTRGQIATARSEAEAARAAHAGQMEVLFVLPDYEAGRPRACMEGWGRRYVLVAPDGVVLPCHAARSLPLSWHDVTSRSLGWIWHESEAFQAYRGEAWMQEPCRSCARREHDFGGCRCQAFALTGNAAATDPSCALAPSHELVADAVSGAGQGLVSIRRRS